MNKTINVALAGVGRVGSTFLEKLLEYHGKGISVVAVAEQSPDAPGVKIARSKDIPVYIDSNDLVEMGDKIDIIFDLTGDYSSKRDLRMAMVKSNNGHTVILPEIVTFFIWDLIAEGKELPNPRKLMGY